jgi:glycolate oxidase FAD binding subunit
MSKEQDISNQLRERVLEAVATGRQLALHGGNSKAFYGREVSGDPLDLSHHRGLVSYEPTELVLTARGGTPVREIEALLSQNAQMLPFEPPCFGPESTIGGAIAAGLAGPRRPWGGAPRDLLLGVKLLDGKGQILNFGGQVMKNVAGYDLSRLMAGAMGALGILLEVSIKVLPAPEQEPTLQFEADERASHAILLKMSGKGVPISASYAYHGVLRVRLACGEERLQQVMKRYGGEIHDNRNDFWGRLKNQQLDFFQNPAPLWRLSLPPAAIIEFDQPSLNEWGGAQRWLHSQLPATEIRARAAKLGGHATLFRNGDRLGELFHPLPARLMDLQRQLKAVFDPHRLFNPGRIYADL